MISCGWKLKLDKFRLEIWAFFQVLVINHCNMLDNDGGSEVIPHVAHSYKL